MLYKLVQEINNVLPITGVSESNGLISVMYIDQPTESQLTTINEILNGWPLEKAKLEKLKELDLEWAETVKTGWTTQAGYKLGIDIQDITLLTGAFILAKEANSIGLTDPSYIVDTEGNSHGLSLPEFTQLMLQYGQARATLSNSYASLKQSINESTSIEELNAINLTI
jgi:hypothetical protein